MAQTLWGNVYYRDIYAGKLQEEPGNRYSFIYDDSYIKSGNQAIAYTLQLSSKPIISEKGLHPFFDNLGAEGWLKNAQSKSLGVDSNNRFALLLGFGYDLAGAVSIIDPEPSKRRVLDHEDKATVAALIGKASLSGVQRKLLVVKEDNNYRLAEHNELSTHIVKLSSDSHHDLIGLEFLTTLAVKTLLPEDNIVEMEVIDNISAIQERALVIKRFDRTPSGERVHFEEFNQLLGKCSEEKYNGSYEDMAEFIASTSGNMSAEIDRLFRRVIVGCVIGNTDAHLKNFAMFHTRDGLRFTPAYDQVGSAFYKEYQSIALKINGVDNFILGQLAAKHIIQLGKNFGLNDKMIISAVEAIGTRIEKAQTTVITSNIGHRRMKEYLTKIMEKRWNGTFASIGSLLSRKQNKGAKNKL